jgi:phosphohistidine phosphatase
MRVFLVRHAVAHERDRQRWPDDSLRPLTPAGRRKFHQAARGLARLLPRSTLILTSPFVRARETAELLSAAGQRCRLEERPELAAAQTARIGLELLRKQRQSCVVLVGHEPYLSNLLSLALAGPTRRIEVEFKKGGAACLEFRGRVVAGGAVLASFLPPKALRALR